MLHLLFAAILHYDVLISAGHEGRPASCAVYHHTCNLGAAGESAWNTVVANAAAAVLRGRGYSVAREPADFSGTFSVRSAVFIHFDGTEPPCSSRASVGYHEERFAGVAAAWKRDYGKIFPFGFMPDNFTTNLSNYYGFRQVHARDAALVLEMGEISCATQKQWLAPRLQLLGETIANFLDGVMRSARATSPSPRRSSGSI